MLSDIQIAQKNKLAPITKIAARIGLQGKDLELYGEYKAKIKFSAIEKLSSKKQGRLILVTAMTPTPFGEGKTTTTIGLGQALDYLGKKTIICLREPSLGPVFGIKGGAAGGGWSQVLPMEDINLHFTGDIHAIGAANNLISAVIDNHLYFGNKLKIDIKNIFWHRAMDMNDRSLRDIKVGLSPKDNAPKRDDHFDITVASEIMAVMCLSDNLADLQKRIKKIVVAQNLSGKPITVNDLKISGAVTSLLKDALKPNLVQAISGTPALVHGGPFANIAHGCNSLTATKAGLKLADFVVTEAGFGADLGAEKFFDIKCRIGKLKPSAVVIVATIRALKHHGNGNILKGLPNLEKHLQNISLFGLTPVIAINRFTTDKELEINQVINFCANKKYPVVICDAWAKGAKGAVKLARKIIKICNTKNSFRYLYPTQKPIRVKIEAIAKQIYGAKKVSFSKKSLEQIKKLQNWGFGNLPICMAKTQASLSDNPKLLGRPKNFILKVKEIKVSAGAGFLVIITGNIMTMPGLPKKPAAELIGINPDGKISGLF